MAKSPAKEEKAAPGEGAAAPKPKGKRPIFIAAGILLLGAIAGAGWFFFPKSSGHAKEAKAPVIAQPKFVALEPFTVNLQHEEGEQFLQIGITLKIMDPEMEERIKTAMPEIRSRLLFLLSSKRASDLSPSEGKKKLAWEIAAETNAALGLRPSPTYAPRPAAHEGHAASGAEGASGHMPAPAETAPAAYGNESNAGVVDVLFTSFIIQ